MAKPSANDNQLTYGAVGYFFAEERTSTGAALGTPDTATMISSIDDLDWETTPDEAADATVTATTNSGEKKEAKRAYTPAASTTSAPDAKVTFNMLESSVNHLDFWKYVDGKYFVCTFPLGTHYNGTTAKRLDLTAFGRFKAGGKINFSGGAATVVPVEFVFETNTVAITAATVTDTNVGNGTSLSATIAQYAGYKLTETTPA